MSKFEKRFLTFLHEQTDGERDAERAAMKASLDEDTPPSEFDVQASSPKTDTLAQQANLITAQQAAEMVSILNGWSLKLDEFAKFINEGPESIQNILAAAPPKSLLAKVHGSEQRKLAPLAALLTGLSGYFKSYSANGKDPELAGN